MVAVFHTGVHTVALIRSVDSQLSTDVPDPEVSDTTKLINDIQPVTKKN